MTNPETITCHAAPFDILSGMENEIATVRDFASALAMLAETFEQAQGAVVQRIAYAITDSCNSIGKRYDKLFPLLHAESSSDLGHLSA